jgi:alpha-tubulin suppressor-like RCC1 family protein
MRFTTRRLASIVSSAALVAGVTGVALAQQSPAGADPTLGAWAWGASPSTDPARPDNGHGQVGRGSRLGSAVPVSVTGLPPGSGVRDVAAGGQHSLALLDDGTVLAWGNQEFGALGNGLTGAADKGTPLVASGLGAGSGVIAISSTGAHNLALRSDGSVLSWGYNSDGQLGDGTFTTRAVAAVIPGLTDVVGISAGSYFSLALKSDGSVWAWGANNVGQLGVPNPASAGIANSTRPIAVPGLGAGSGVVQVAAGLSHAIARTDDDRVYSWGPDKWVAPMTNLIIQPAHLVAGITGHVVDIDAGGLDSLAAMADGSMLAWGDASYGRGCNGAPPYRDSAGPTDFGPGAGVVEVEAGYQSTLVRLADGSVFGCGYDGNNELGTGVGGVISGSGAVVQLHPIAVDGAGPGSGITHMALGGMHAVVTGVSLQPTHPSDPTTTTSSTTPSTTSTTAPVAPLATASIGDVVVSEGDTGKRTAAATITLDHPVSVKTTVKVSTSSTDASFRDYTSFSNKVVTFAAGTASQTVPVTIFGDTSADGTKSVTLKLAPTPALAVGDGTGTMTIADDDAPSAIVPELRVSDVRAYEGDSGATKLQFTVALSRPATQTVSVRLSTVSFTASTTSDLVARSNVKLSFAAGTQSKLFTISLRDDGTLEPDEAFFLQATTPVGISITDDLGLGTIANDD